MVWFKVDDTFPHHSKVMAAGNGAVGLWVRAGAWSMQQLTDGFIPSHVAQTLGSKSEARSLVQVGLWVEVDGGYTFHQWTEVQRTKAQVRADRDAATERQRHAREAAKSRRDSQRESQTSHAVSHGPPDQTRPDQTSSSYGTTKTVVEDLVTRKSAKRSTRLPEAWEPTAEHEKRAAAAGIDLAGQADRFRAHAEANDRKQANWSAAFTQWLLGVKPWEKQDPAAKPRTLPAARDIEQPPDGLTPVEYAAWDRQQRARRHA